MATLARRAARTPLPPVVAVMFGAVAAILVAAVPTWMFESAVSQSLLPSILPYAAPPLGLTARILAVGFAFAVTAIVLWVLLTQLEKLVKAAGRDRLPWQDDGYSEPDEPVKVEGRRRPIFAPAELGAPLMSDEAIAVLSAEPEPIFEATAELEIPLSAVEFDLPPSVATDVDEEDQSILSLIRRLESGLARSAANDPRPDSPGSVPSPFLTLRERIASKSNRTDMQNDETTDDLRQALGALKLFASR